MGLSPVNAWPLAWVALLPLWGLLYQPQLSSRQVLLGSALWGLAYHGTALSWIVWWLKPLLWMGVPWLGGVFLTLLAWVFITVWGAAIGTTWMGLMLWVRRWWVLSGWRRLLIGTALWCAVEWVWSRGPLYWTSLSYTQSPGNLIGLQLGQWSGPITITAGIVAVNGLLAAGIWDREGANAKSREQKKGQKKGPRKAGTDRPSNREWNQYCVSAIALFLSFHLAGLMLYNRPAPSTDASNRPQSLSVGLIQGNVPTDQKLTSEGVAHSRQIYLDGYEQLVAEGADIVITPEGSISRTWNAFLQDRDILMRAVINHKVPLLLGTFAHLQIDDSATPLTQSLLMLTPDGKVSGRYNKVKLVPLGEYLPFEKTLKKLLGPLLPWNGLAPGSRDQQLQTPYAPIAAGICYESAFTELFRQQVHQGGQAIFTASNNDPYPPRQMMQHHAQDVMRAIETDRWAVRVTNTGISGVVDSHGRTQWIAKPHDNISYRADITLKQTQTPYVRWGDWLTPLLLGISALSLYNRNLK